MTILRSILVVLVIGLYLATAGLFMVVYGILTRNEDLIYRVGVAGVKLVLLVAGVRIEVEGRERLRPGPTCVYMSNHAGNVDPLALVVFLPRVSALAKHTVFRIPVLGAAMRIARFIPVVRGTSQAASTVEAGAQLLRSGLSLMVFPEGTRSETEKMLPFRRGVFVMAIRAGVPIIPITLLGCRNIMRKGDPRMHSGTVRAIVHEPIPTAGLSEQDRHELAERVRAVIVSALPPGEPTEVSGARK